jgi:hypothetical protein
VSEQVLARGGTVVRFEDLVADPEPALTTACAAVGVEYDPVMLAGTGSSTMLPEYRRSRLDPRTTVADDVPAWWTDLIRDDLHRAGYLA